MKIMEVLHESFSKSFIDVRDCPDWVKKVLSKEGLRRPVKLKVGVEVNTPSNWNEANHKILYLYNNGEVQKQSGAFTDSILSSNKKEQAVHNGIKVRFENPDQMILEVNTYPKGATLYVHPEAMNKFISQEKDDVSKDEETVLIATRMWKNTYGGQKNLRFKNAQRETGITQERWEKAKENLIKNKYLTKAGALTTKGRNIAGDKML